MNASIAARILAAALLLAGMAAAAESQSFRVEPRDPSTLAPVRVTVSVFASSDPHLQFDGLHGNQIDFLADPPDLVATPSFPYASTVEIGPLPAGIYQVVLLFRGGTTTARHSFQVRAPEPFLTLPEQGDGWSFEMAIDWKLPSGQTGQGFGVPLTDESGYFWFFSPGNIEVTVKILDGRPVNGHWWVFLASMTDVEFTATVSRCPPPPIGAPCVLKQYHSPQGINRNFLDTQAF